MTVAQCQRYISSKYIVWLLALVAALFLVQSGAQTFPGIYSSNDTGSLAGGLFQNLGLADAGNDPAPAQCHVRVIANDVVVSAREWHEVAHHVQPPGVVENPDQWPFFAWSDTPSKLFFTFFFRNIVGLTARPFVAALRIYQWQERLMKSFSRQHSGTARRPRNYSTNIMMAGGISRGWEERRAKCLRTSPARPMEIHRWYGVHIEGDLSRSWIMSSTLPTANPRTDFIGRRCK